MNRGLDTDLADRILLVELLDCRDNLGLIEGSSLFMGLDKITAAACRSYNHHRAPDRRETTPHQFVERLTPMESDDLVEIRHEGNKKSVTLKAKGVRHAEQAAQHEGSLRVAERDMAQELNAAAGSIAQAAADVVKGAEDTAEIQKKALWISCISAAAVFVSAVAMIVTALAAIR